MLPNISGEFRVVDDPELRFTPAGKAVASCRIVANSRKKQGEEWVDDKVCWLNLSAWERMAENLAESVLKGDLIYVTGRLETRSYETREGEKRQSFDVTADTVAVTLRWNSVKVDRPQRSGQQQQSSSQQQTQSTESAADTWQSTGQTEEPPF
jgi:single-strand DNA-binding protein